MADFIQNSQTKTAVRELTSPIPDVAAFNTIVQSVITDNPFGCVAYMTAGENHAPVEKTREAYTARLMYQDGEANAIGNGSHRFSTLAGFNAGVTAVLAAADVSTAHGGSALHDAENDSFTATLRCHDVNGELYMVNFSRSRVTLTSYSDDAIRTSVETWADTVPALA